MESSLFQKELRTDHEPDRVAGELSRCKQCGRCILWRLVPGGKIGSGSWTSAHFGEARVGFPVGEICLFQNTLGFGAIRRAPSIV